MAGNIKGITIEFRGDTTQLDKAIRQVEKESKSLDTELKNVNRALKFNPKNTELMKQKFQIMSEKISKTEEKLESLKQAQKEMDASGVDKNSKEYRELRREIIETTSKLKTMKAQLQSVAQQKLSALGKQFQEVGKKMKSAGKTMSMYVTAPLTAIGTVAAQKFADVDKTMQLTNATMGNTAEQAELLDKAMKDAAANSTFGMSDAATATLNFARAGLTAEQAAATLAPAMNLAAGEGGELDTVSQGLVATINGFGDSFDEAARYADVFANACNNSALDVNSLSNAMSIAAPVFSAAGYSVEDAALYMGVMANAGIDANVAATALKTGMARLVSPTKQADTWLDKLGLSFENADGSMKDTLTIQKDLNEAFSGLSESEQLAAASAIFGKNQMANWLALINTAPEDVATLSESIFATGTTTEMAEAMMSGFGGSLEKLKSSIDVAATSIGQALAPMILYVSNLVQKAVDWFNNLSPSMQTVVATIGVVVAAIGPLLIVLGAVTSGIGSLMTVVSKLIPIIAGISPVMLAVVAAIAAAIAIGILLYKNWDKIKAFAVKTWGNIKETIGSAVENIKQKWENLKTKAGATFEAIKEKVTKPFKTAFEFIRNIIEKIKGLFKGDWELPKIKLPHFKITGKFSIAPPSVPKLSIDWYKEGAIFAGPSVIGVGEAGAEAVLPLEKLWKEMDRRFGEGGGAPVVNITVNASPGMNVNELAAEVEKRMTRALQQKRRAWA